MGFPKINFRVCEVKQCPLYLYNDVVQIAGIAISMENNGESSLINTTAVYFPPSRSSCKILSADLTRIIIEYERADQIPDCLISCSGCTGSIRLEHFRMLSRGNDSSNPDSRLEDIVPLLNDLPFFRNIDPAHRHTVFNSFKVRNCVKNEIILRKGDPNESFFIVASGRVTVFNDAEVPISTLRQGDVFGEMSLICDENVGATVQAVNVCRLLQTDRQHFRNMLQMHPSLQHYFTRLFAKRLTDTNKMRSDEYASGMIGTLEEISLEALFQTLHLNQKTGVLTITQLSKGIARFSMRKGALIKAYYAGRKGKTAFQSVLHEKNGRFKFQQGLPAEDAGLAEIGNFMKLLMEGLQSLDEHATTGR
ncbi:cyclic nucleotide-binding domain-containing protein [Desulfobulbus oligotrophicus]|jgi:CRP-like cAMP-binding protein|uniref:Cyclic nucleotide-binding domain-containing protein n=1 Tax=Desulfobulbus oligotrophicus TaxID=1909699 RepID=A0A7T5VFA1_9BACT|nr:cyclic nucleotide-binding domain-containing protein [Desulfobulbus oligotrophicus]MDY0389885.1 cyclic nucleotide-binding domain-containing protein [Desulfobulbus oligotrophicus]QQG66853.1 cyclic nucleotide-binding domain-containing protein [Desulfobulbus oligotrophicus]